jgi:hypothetical protein
VKLKFIIALLIPLIFGSTVRAIDGVIDESPSTNVIANEPSSGNTQNQGENSVTLNSSSSLGVSSSIGAEDTSTTMAWPAIPGESLNDIARLFYPKNKIMRQQFVLDTMALNADGEAKLKASDKFSEPTLLQIPTLKSLSQKVSVIKAKRAKAKRQKMQMSYNINQAVSKLPAFLLQEYEALLEKNAFLKAELERLQARLSVLQDKFNNLKLVFDKTMKFPANTATPNTNTLPSATPDIPIANAAAVKAPEPKIEPKIEAQIDTQVAANAPQVKKVFKNLTQASKALAAPVVAAPQAEPETHSPAYNWLKYGLLALLVAMFLLSIAAFYIQKRRQRMLDHLSESLPTMDDTITDFGGQWQDTEQEIESQYVVEHEQSPSAQGFLNTQMRDEQAKATSTLEEAKLLMSINRTQDAIAHLKLTIESQPKSSINHWLYLLEIFRKQNAKEAFEQYAKSLHQTFNVMTPVWYETQAAIVVSQQLEDFPHIIEKLDAVWPSELARVYLESLITDNRDGERAGFSQSVLDEILLLIGILDARKELE